MPPKASPDTKIQQNIEEEKLGRIIDAPPDDEEDVDKEKIMDALQRSFVLDEKSGRLT